MKIVVILSCLWDNDKKKVCTCSEQIQPYNIQMRKDVYDAQAISAGERLRVCGVVRVYTSMCPHSCICKYSS